MDDPSIDMAVVCSILSSNVDIAIAPNTCFAAEVGLSGEIRPVPRIEQRISEAEKMGFERIYISKYNKGISVSNYEYTSNSSWKNRGGLEEFIWLKVF